MSIRVFTIRNTAALTAVICGALGVAQAAAEEVSCAASTVYDKRCANVGAPPSTAAMTDSHARDSYNSVHEYESRTADPMKARVEKPTATGMSDTPVAVYSPDATSTPSNSGYVPGKSLLDTVRSVQAGTKFRGLYWNYKADLAQFEMGGDTTNSRTRTWLADWIRTNTANASDELIIKLASILAAYDASTQVLANTPVFETPKLKKVKFFSGISDQDHGADRAEASDKGAKKARESAHTESEPTVSN